MNPKQLLARELMTTPPLVVGRDATLREAGRMMTLKKVHCLLVPADEGRCIGVITSKDIVQILDRSEIDVLDRLRVSDAMTSPAITVQEEFVIADCLRLMRMSGIRTAPVLRGLIPVGILSFTDILARAVSD